MKRIISIAISVVMIAAVLLGMTGCGEEKDKELIGKWEITVDIFEITGPMFDDDDELGQYIEVDEFVITMHYEFGKKGTYKIYTDEEQLEKSVKGVTDAIRTGLEEYFQDYLAEEGMDLTVDELLEASDMSMDSLIEAMFGEEVVQELIDDLVTEGQYYVKDGMIYMSDSLEEEPSEEAGQKYEISGNELTLYAPEGATEEEAEGYPLLLKSGK